MGDRSQSHQAYLEREKARDESARQREEERKKRDQRRRERRERLEREREKQAERDRKRRERERREHQERVRQARANGEPVSDLIYTDPTPEPYRYGRELDIEDEFDRDLDDYDLGRDRYEPEVPEPPPLKLVSAWDLNCGIWPPLVGWTIFGTVLAVMVCWITATAIDEHTITQHTETQPVVSLADSQESYGEFYSETFLISGATSGRVAPKLSYSWYTQDPSDSDAPIKGVSGIHEDNNTRVEIYYTEGDPYVERITWSNDSETPSWLAPFNLNGSSHSSSRRWDPENPVGQELYKIYVPEGSIVERSKLDLK